MMPSVKEWIWTTSSKFAKEIANSYVAGPNLTDAIRVSRSITAAGDSATIGYWSGKKAPALVADYYCVALGGLSTLGTDSYLSIKLPALGYSTELLDRVLDKALEEGQGIHFDSLGPKTVDLTIEHLERLLPSNVPLGFTLPGRWARSLADAEWVIGAGLPVRVVKGQWEDPGAPEIGLRDGFLAVIDRLAGYASRVMVATHDVWLAERAIDRLLAAGTPCDLELLYGLPTRDSLRLARQKRINLRFYVPYGEAWLPYSISQLHRHPSTLWWIAKDIFVSIRGSQDLARSID